MSRENCNVNINSSNTGSGGLVSIWSTSNRIEIILLIISILLSHLSLGWLYVDGLMQERHTSIVNALELRLSCTNPSIFSVPFCRLLTTKWFVLHLRYLEQNKYRSGKKYWITFPWPKVMAVALINKNVGFFFSLLHNKVKSTDPITTKLVRFWRNSAGNFFQVNFFKIPNMFFQGQTFYWPYLRISLSDWNVNIKESALVGHFVNYATSDFDVTHWPWPWIFQVQF